MTVKITDRQERIPHFKQDTLRAGKIFVAGAGATGNEVLKNLGLVGCGGYVLISDMDHISTSNISRTVLFTPEDIGKRKAATAAQRLEAMHIDHGMADSFEGDICYELGEGIISQFDLVINCVDNVQTRLFLSHICKTLGIPYIDTGIDAFDYALFTDSGEKECSCYACTLSSKNEKHELSRIRNSCDVTRRKAAKMGEAPTIVLSAAEVGARAVQEAVKILHHQQIENSQMYAPNFGHMLIYSAADNQTRNLKIPVRKDCPHHRQYKDIGEIIRTPISCEWTLRETFNWVQRNYGAGYCLSLLKDCCVVDRAFVTTANCKHCGAPIDVYRPQHTLNDDDLLCKTCKDAHLSPDFPSGGVMKVFFEETEEERILNMKLREIGIPAGHLLQFEHMEEGRPSLFFVLTGDFDKIMPKMPK